MENEKNSQYKAKERYTDKNVATAYDEERFTSWVGQIAHKIESDALAYSVDRYFEKGGSILDIPCGTGRLLPVLLNRGFLVTGGDISNEMIQVAQKKYGNATFKVVDAENLPFSDNAFDYVTSYRLMCHLPKDVRRKVLGEMVRVARKTVVVNYHFTSLAPVAILNQLFRPTCCATYPVKMNEISGELPNENCEILEIRKLSWFERSSSLVVIKKKN
ncbi:MAG: hypothetical protein A3G33_02910 [Omnitrophica bacterium RIFCSPLOWO2_12_FULL_44_17]|uniref:Methyltransferase domain-containing protein n=1 Tax=Candidatus Danuiimicrobium aquiferis TaxID=1801832 RepID=A0A1G1KWH9_9BACT|nr:MAG: hypothetical protein A3B72_04390 [Omnitrophica bacterium RIFCSPHIGHO2_02_FULL_45_28]OGW90422.1 MAG: hypothetical protein A3E74_04205 [Omnitrophica bacterium RIFCSPHIGHO2_12_FULL_44_12]OGW96929.1 MAG: hypothetical protein A3G33_02910 [Omnitrophica bacterium RIFCSPLOWO2_12_FULL_44_17]OGX03935.1 MAG: hypothetical protein A3J12_03505 [Omnitrophica bacterium RIFCSPLOWO2_02_FULL_44_11]